VYVCMYVSMYDFVRDSDSNLKNVALNVSIYVMIETVLDIPRDS
jgi:hypothetical protein